jgi:hypothetical protein
LCSQIGEASTDASQYFHRKGILHRVSCPHTSQQNGIAECKHWHIVETGIALLTHSSLHVRFWIRISLHHATS